MRFNGLIQLENGFWAIVCYLNAYDNLGEYWNKLLPKSSRIYMKIDRTYEWI